MRIQAVVTDFDASFTSDQGVADDARSWATVQALRDAGVKVVLNTGRDLHYLIGPTGILHWSQVAMFDMIIAEDGAVAWDPRANRLQIIGEPISPYFIDALRQTAVAADPDDRIDSKELWIGHASVGTMRDRLQLAKKVLRRKNAYLKRLGVPPISVEPIVNGNSVTWVKAGVNKGTGMLWALQQLGVDPARVVAIGDGDNDAAFMKLAGIAAPVANAKPELHALSNAICVRGSAADGFREVAQRLLDGELDRLLDDPGLSVAG